MAIDKDGYLFVTSGDRNYGELVRDPATTSARCCASTATAPCRATIRSSAAQGWAPEIWSTGHRNQTGLTIDPATGTMWETEFGPRGGDEVNRIERGAQLRLAGRDAGLSLQRRAAGQGRAQRRRA